MAADHDHRDLRLGRPRGGLGDAVGDDLLGELRRLRLRDQAERAVGDAHVRVGQAEPALDRLVSGITDQVATVGLPLQRELLGDVPAVGLGVVGVERAPVAAQQPAVARVAQRGHAAGPVGEVPLRGGAGRGVEQGGVVVGPGAGRGDVPAGVEVLERDALQPFAGGDGAHPLLDPVSRRHLVRQLPRVPVPVQPVRQRPHHGGRLRPAEGQHTGVLQQHGRLAGGLPVEPLVGRTVDHVRRDPRVRPAVRIEVAQPGPDGQHVAYRLVHVGHGDAALVERGLEVGQHRPEVAAVDREAVQPGLQHGGERLGLVVVVALQVGERVRPPRVAGVVERLFGPGPDRVVQVRVDVVGPPVDQVVRRHHPGRGVGRDRRLEGRLVVLVLELGRQVGGGEAAVGLVVVGQVVLEHGRGLQVEGVVTLEPLAVRGRDGPGEQRILGVALLVAPRARVAQQVDHRRPHLQPPQDGIDGVVAARLVAHGRADLPDQRRVPGAGQPDRLREDGAGGELLVPVVVAVVGPGDTVQRLGAVLVVGDAEARDRRLRLVQQAQLLVEGEPAEQVGDALVERQGRVLERVRLRGLNGGRDE